MSFDNTCKFIVENFSIDVATWLLGTPVALTKLESSELFAEPVRADAVIFLVSQDLLIQVEFQTNPDPNIGFRMTDYRLRGFRRYPNKQMRQIVSCISGPLDPNGFIKLILNCQVCDMNLK
jgi:predicted transposase/invertase (TIGR01784 family)